jgi:hypothetical protein
MKTWKNDIPMTKEEKETIRLLRKAGCRCELPLLGYIPDQGPRCRLCGTEIIPVCGSQIAEYESQQTLKRMDEPQPGG